MSHHHTDYCLYCEIREVNRKLDEIMSAQSDIAAAVTAVSGLLLDIADRVSEIGTDVADIVAELAGKDVDTTALNAVVAKINGVQSALDAAVENLDEVASPPSTSASTSTSTSTSTSASTSTSTTASTSTSASASTSTAAEVDPVTGQAPGLI